MYGRGVRFVRRNDMYSELIHKMSDNYSPVSTYEGRNGDGVVKRRNPCVTFAFHLRGRRRGQRKIYRCPLNHIREYSSRLIPRPYRSSSAADATSGPLLPVVVIFAFTAVRTNRNGTHTRMEKRRRLFVFYSLHQ